MHGGWYITAKRGSARRLLVGPVQDRAALASIVGSVAERVPEEFARTDDIDLDIVYLAETTLTLGELNNSYWLVYHLGVLS